MRRFRSAKVAGVVAPAQLDDVRGLRTLRAGFHRELDFLTLGEIAEARTRDGRIVHEHIRPALTSDKTVPLLNGGAKRMIRAGPGKCVLGDKKTVTAKQP